MCRIRAINRYKNIFNYNMTLLHLVYSVKSRFQIFKRESGYKPWLYDITIDACQFLRKPSNAAIIYLVKQAKNFTNFFDQKCPVSVIYENFKGNNRYKVVFIFYRGLKP